MTVDELQTTVTADGIGAEAHGLIRELYPICRSITGDGVRASLAILTKHIPLDVTEVPTGTAVFDWVVPKEWNIRDAWIARVQGQRVVDFEHSNLHVVGYSVPIRRRLSRAELIPHLFTLPEHPEWIPYRTSFFEEGWGFCVSHKTLLAMTDDEYEVCIDSSLEDGHLTYGEYYLGGNTPDEVLVHAHACHPSMANDNLSGVALTALLARALGSVRRRYSYRFLFLPGMIGAITWLARNQATVSRIRHGLILACVGDPGHSTYKKSRRGDAEIDRAVPHVLKHSGSAYEVVEFSPYGYDERQYCSPGFNLPVGCLTRTPHGRFPQYHTSADDVDFVRPESLGDSFVKILRTLAVLEGNRVYLNQNPRCEPQLGRRGLYGPLGGQGAPVDTMALLWVLNLSDGEHSLLDIAERAGLEFSVIRRAAAALETHGLLLATPTDD